MTFTLGPGDVVESGSTGGAMSTLDLPFNQLDTQVVDNGGHIILTLGAGVAVVWNKDKTANIKIPISFMNNGMTGKYCDI